jgi:hypothetical protein
VWAVHENVPAREGALGVLSVRSLRWLWRSCDGTGMEHEGPALEIDALMAGMRDLGARAAQAMAEASAAGNHDEGGEGL